jgi:glucoamylase
MESLGRWIDRQYHYSAAAMMKSVSCNVVKARPGFGQVICPSLGSIVASPVLAAYDPEPDYFFHWYRDSAIVVDAMRLLAEDPRSGIDTRKHFADFVQFSLSLRNLDGRMLVEDPRWRGRITDEFQRFVRTDAELMTVHGASASAETRVNPDGSIDISNWPRPQYDGIAMRVLTVVRWLRNSLVDTNLAEVEALLRGDLEVVRRHARSPGFDIWEEEKGFHYYTLRVAAAALRAAAVWLAERGEDADSRACDLDAGDILRRLDGYWDDHLGYFRSRILENGMLSGKGLDFAVVLAAIHSDAGDKTHSANDRRMRATLLHLETLFDSAYPINQARPADRAPAMGRYAGDVYFSGGAYYFSTLGAAEFYFQAASHDENPRPLIERGDAFLRTVRHFTPAHGELSEQFDQHDGVQRSARHLAWSYAAFISCVAARRRAVLKVK